MIWERSNKDDAKKPNRWKNQMNLRCWTFEFFYDSLILRRNFLKSIWFWGSPFIHVSSSHQWEKSNSDKYFFRLLVVGETFLEFNWCILWSCILERLGYQTSSKSSILHKLRQSTKKWARRIFIRNDGFGKSRASNDIELRSSFNSAINLMLKCQLTAPMLLLQITHTQTHTVGQLFSCICI